MINKCKICNCVTNAIVNSKNGDVYYVCGNCEFISKDDASIVSNDEELTVYNLHNNSLDDEKYVEFLKNFVDNAVVGFENGGKLGLDFGSGPSPVLATILERDYGYKMDIYDKFYSPAKIYENKKYNLVTSTEVVEHLKTPMEYFKLFKDLITPSGTIAIMTLFHNMNTADFFNWWYIRDKTHISFYTPKTMQVIAELLNLKVVFCNNNRQVTFKKIS